MLFAGIDVGSLTGKAVLLKSDGATAETDDNLNRVQNILAHKVIRVKKTPVETAQTVFQQILEETNLKKEDVNYIVSTGYGRDNIPFSNKSVTEITCHGVGAHYLIPSVRTIIDIGGQDCKLISVDRTGKLVDFAMNEKCSAGTGRYLELMAALLHISLTELGTISLKSKSPIAVKSTCSIYAQAEVLQYISSGHKKENIAAGINKAMAERVYSMAKRVKIKKDIVISGGVAKNVGVVRYLEDMLGETVGQSFYLLKHTLFLQMPVDPQICGALGAAVIASQKYQRL